MPKALVLKAESIRVLSRPELDDVGGGQWVGRAFRAVKKLFDLETVKIARTDGPGESYNLGYPARNDPKWNWNPGERVWNRVRNQ